MKGFLRYSQALAGAAALALVAPAMAQDGTTPRATAYAEAAKLPDWIGIWYPDWTASFASRDNVPKLTPQAKAAYDAYLESVKEHGPNQEAQAQCLPPGLPGILQQPYPIEILYSPGQVTVLTEAYSQVRRIYTDGRPLPAEPDLFFNGNSIGRWEGDTLVVTTVGLNTSTYIAPGIRHGEKMRIDEKIWLDKPGLLIDELVITDPETLTEPYTVRLSFKLDNSYPIREYVCSENNHLVTGENGANIDLRLENDEVVEDPFGEPAE